MEDLHLSSRLFNTIKHLNRKEFKNANYRQVTLDLKHQGVQKETKESGKLLKL